MLSNKKLLLSLIIASSQSYLKNEVQEDLLSAETIATISKILENAQGEDVESFLNEVTRSLDISSFKSWTQSIQNGMHAVYTYISGWVQAAQHHAQDPNNQVSQTATHLGETAGNVVEPLLETALSTVVPSTVAHLIAEQVENKIEELVSVSADFIGDSIEAAIHELQQNKESSPEEETKSQHNQDLAAVTKGVENYAQMPNRMDLSSLYSASMTDSTYSLEFPSPFKENSLCNITVEEFNGNIQLTNNVCLLGGMTNMLVSYSVPIPAGMTLDFSNKTTEILEHNRIKISLGILHRSINKDFSNETRIQYGIALFHHNQN